MTKLKTMLLNKTPFYIAGLAALGMTLSACNNHPTNNNGAEKFPDNHTSWGNSAQMDKFIDELMAKMTLEEKLGQMTLVSAGWDSTGPTLRGSYKEDVKAGRAGAVFNAYTVKFTTELQRVAVEETRLGIPLLFGYDVVHGHRTIFPLSLGEAASWDLEAIEKSARISAIEASAEGVHWTFAPMVDISRDPRWGRVSEGAGEDVYLGSRIAEARVRGFQGNNLRSVDTVLSTVKHFAAYGAAQAGRDYHTTDMSDVELRETYLPPFKAALDAGAATVMTAFNDLNGTPATGSAYLLQDILRDEWGFEGFVVADYTAVKELIQHGFAEDGKHAAELAVNAGTDMDMESALYLENLKESVGEGKVSINKIDDAVSRILEMKYRLGLFDDPYRYSDAERQANNVMTAEHLEASRDVARKSIVLLKNDNKTLPLSNEIRSIALVGPLASSKEDLIGSWSAAGDRTEKPVSLLEGLRARAGNEVNIKYAKGADYHFGSESDESGYAEAIGIASESDVVVVAMGEKWDMSGEAASRTSLTLPGSQQGLLKELVKLNKPIVLVVMSGRPLNLEWADENVDAITAAWYPGTMGGHAIADVLFGHYNPSAKLPMSFPRDVGQVPVYYNMKNTGRPYSSKNPEQKYLSRYLQTANDPLYPFGYGLSYTTFEYSDFKVINEVNVSALQKTTASLPLSVEVTITNTGKLDGAEVAQFYIQDIVGSITRPVKQLKGFEKLVIKKGESKTIQFVLTEEDLSFQKANGDFGFEPGRFKLFVGGSSDNVRELELLIESHDS